MLGDLGPTKSAAVYTKAWDSFMSFLESDVREVDAHKAPESDIEIREGSGGNIEDELIN
jgi:hypothetical protein